MHRASVIYFCINFLSFLSVTLVQFSFNNLCHKPWPNLNFLMIFSWQALSDFLLMTLKSVVKATTTLFAMGGQTQQANPGKFSITLRTTIIDVKEDTKDCVPG